MRKTELIVLGEAIHPKTKASIVEHEHTNIEATLDQQNRVSSTITQSTSMSQVGLGDGVDLSFCVKDGFYENATLYGKTMVNCIQESSSKDIVLPYMFEEGQSVTINDTKESGALGVELKGQTLVNLAKKSTYKFSHHQDEASKYTFTSELNRVSITINEATTQWRYSLLGLHLNMLKPNTKYFVKFEGNFKGNVTIKAGDSSGALTNTATIGSNNYVIITTNDLSGSVGSQGLYFYPAPPNQYPHTYTLANVVLTEYQEGMENWDIPYFEGMTSCKMPILHSCQQLFDYNAITKPSISGDIGFVKNESSIKVSFSNTNRDVHQNTSILIPAGTYKVSYMVRGKIESVGDTSTINASKVGIAFSIDKAWSSGGAKRLEYQFVNLSETEFTYRSTTFTFDEPQYVTIFYHGWNNNPVGWCEFKDVRITQQGKSSILQLPEGGVLRSLPNGVCDTFNTRTGVYTQRVGEVVLNGSEGWNPNNTEGTTTQRFFCNMLTNSAVENSRGTQQYSCDRLRTITWNQTCELGLTVNGSGVFVYNNAIEYSASSVKQWLSQNPVRLQYELKTPIVTRINLPSTLKSWNTTTHIYSEIPENTLYPILSHSNATYPVILKPSTKYSIVANSYSNNHTNSAINFNLGGVTASTTVGNRVTTITTPSTLSNELLTMSGRGNKLNNVMVIEGDVAGDESYFEGICDCKSPILSNVGKNLFTTRDSNVGTHPNHKLDVLGENHIEITATTNETGWLYTTYEVKGLVPNTTYILSGDVSEGANNSSGSKGVMLIHDFNTSTSTASVNSSNRAIRYTTPKDVTKVRVLFYSSLNQTPNKIGDTYSFKNIQLEKAQDITTYEPYKSNTTTFNQKDDKTIVLRSLPSGVCDTLNVETGEYTQRIGEYTYNGDNDVKQHYVANNNHGQPYFTIEVSSLGRKEAIGGIGDTLPHESIYSAVKQTKNAFCVSLGGNTVIRFYIDGLTTTEQYQNHFRNAPITIQYELATPIVSTIDVQGFPHAYKDGHVQLSSGHSGQSLTPKIEYVIQVNRAGTIQANQDRLINHDKRLAALENFMLCQLIQLEYNHAKCVFFAQTRQLFEGGNTMYHTKYDLLSEFIEKKLYRSLNEVCEMLDVYYMLGDITDGEYDTLYEMLLPTEEVEEFFEEAEESI